MSDSKYVPNEEERRLASHHGIDDPVLDRLPPLQDIRHAGQARLGMVHATLPRLRLPDLGSPAGRPVHRSRPSRHGIVPELL